MTASPPAIWPGTELEGFELLRILDGNCACVIQKDSGKRLTTCAGHMQLTDPRALAHLVYARRLRDRLEAEEWSGVYEREEPLV